VTLRDVFLIEYSPSQKVFHVESFYDYIKTNQRAFFERGWLSDYVPICICRSRQHASYACARLISVWRD